MALGLKSLAFEEGCFIPAKYTCKGDDVSPPLKWDSVPKEAQGLALICDDPDAPGMVWVHWVIYNIPTEIDGLRENEPKGENLANGALQGINDFGRTGYGGPCPPPGRPHRYYFKLYALDVKLDARPRMSKEELLEAMEGHILAEAQLMGKFQR